MKNEHKIHVAYILSILIAIIIALTTSRWGDNPRLVEFIAFFATLTSLILSILAIAYAVYANSSLAQTVYSLRDASDKVSGAAVGVSDATNELESKIQEIPTKLTTVEGKVDQLLLIGQSTPATATGPRSDADVQATSRLVERFLSRIPLNTLLATYSFYKAYRSELEFDFISFFSEFGLDGKYTMGAYSVLNCAGFLDHDRVGKRLTIVRFDEVLAEELENNLPTILERCFVELENGVGKTAADRMRGKITEQFGVLNAYFSELTTGNLQ